MCITEYNEAETMQLFKEHAHREGRAESIRGTIQILRGPGLAEVQIKDAIIQHFDLQT